MNLANPDQIVPPKFRGPTKMLYYIHQTPLSYCSVEGGSGEETSSSLTVSQASTITVEAITTIQTRNNNINRWVMHSLLIIIVELELFFKHSDANAQCYTPFC